MMRGHLGSRPTAKVRLIFLHHHQFGIELRRDAGQFSDVLILSIAGLAEQQA